MSLPEEESRTQGSRPRTQKNFEAKAKDRPSRGQGQGPRTQAQLFSKKKVFKKFFRAISKKKSSKKFFLLKFFLIKIFFLNIKILLIKIKKKNFNEPACRSMLFFFSFSKKFFMAKKVFKIIFSGDFHLRKTKKGLRKFSARFLALSNEISTVQKIVLSSSRGQGNF